MAKRYTKKTTKRKYAKKRSYKKKSSIKKMIKREISRQAEDKEAVVLNLGRNIYSVAAGAFDSSNIIECGFSATALNIAQGTSQGGRVGNKIRVKKLKIQGTLVPQPYSATTNPDPQPCQYRMILLYNKNTPNAVPTPQASADIVQFGSTVSSFDDDLIDQWAPLNTDTYTVLAEKRCKVGFALNSATNQTPGTIMPGQVMANNDFKLNYSLNWDITKYIPKVVTYKDNNVDATSRGLYLVIVPSSARGTALGSAAIVASFSYALTVKYEDF